MCQQSTCGLISPIADSTHTLFLCDTQVVREAHVLDNSAPVTDAHLDQYSGTNSTGQGYVLDATPCYMDNPRAPCRVHR